MPFGILGIVLGLITSLPSDIAAISSAWAALRGAFARQPNSAAQVAAIDAILAVLNPEVDAVTAKLHVDALKASQGQAADGTQAKPA